MALRRVIADSSSIILLQKVRLLDVFLQNYSVLITRHVYDELTEAGKKGSSELGNLLADKIIQVTGGNRLEGLGRGESSVITLYFDGTGDFVLLDDKKGAKYCKSQAIPFINALLVSRILWLTGTITEDDYRAATKQLIREGYYGEMIIEKAAEIQDVELQQFMPR